MRLLRAMVLSTARLLQRLDQFLLLLAGGGGGTFRKGRMLALGVQALLLVLQSLQGKMGARTISGF